MRQIVYPITFFASSHKGLSRSQNEDVWAVEENLFVLADGMGGHNAGEVAAQMAVSTLVELFSSYEGGESKEEVKDFCKRAVVQVNQRVCEQGHAHLEWKGMGSTLSALFFIEKIVAVMHVGDSRIYRLRGGILKQLTVDHTVMNRMKGVEEAVLFKHVLTRAIGTHKGVKPQIQTYPVYPQDRYLLCSDGLTNYVSDCEIEQEMAGENLETICDHFVQTALDRGGGDNITLIVAEVGE